MKKIIPILVPVVLLLTVGFYGLFYKAAYVTTIPVIQTVPPETLAIGHDRSRRVGDTVTITGRVVAPPRVNPSGGDFRVLMRSTNSRTAYIQDTTNALFGGIIVRQNDSVSNTQFDLLDSGSKVTVTGIVQEFPDIISSGVTQIKLDSVLQVQQLPTIKRRPTPINVNVTDFDSLGDVKFRTGERYEGMYVQLTNLTVGPQSPSGQRNIRSLLDAQGNKIYLRDFSNFYSLGPSPPTGWTTWSPPSIGANVISIRGVIINSAYADANGGLYGYVIVPIYPNDLTLGNTPPFISTVSRSPGVPKPVDSVQVTATVVDTLDNPVSVDSVQLIYKINTGNYITKQMTQSGNIYFTKIAPQPLGTLVQYFIRARDNQGAIRLSPSDTSRSRFFYYTRLSDTMTIKDVQYTPNQGGFSGWNGYDVSTEGIVTADTSDYRAKTVTTPGGTQTWARKVFIQDPAIAGGWSGIWIAGGPTDVLVKGQRVRIRGTVQEDNGMTKINIATSGDVNIISSGNPLPAFEVMNPSVVANSKPDGDTTIEKWEGVLIRFSNLTSISCINASSNTGCTSTLPLTDTSFRRNFSEMMCMYTSEGTEARVELSGNHNYTNGWDPNRANWYNQGLPGTLLFQWNGFSSLQGVLFYSFGRYRMIPRNTTDFGTVIGIQPITEAPSVYWLRQNYPNPFNPVSTITYNLPYESEVKITVYNLIGQEVSVLVHGIQNRGKYNVLFDGTNLASGMYIYKIEAISESGQKFSDIKKMVLVK